MDGIVLFGLSNNYDTDDGVYLNASLSESKPLTQFFSHERVRVVRLVEESFQLGQLVHRKVGPTPTLFCLLLLLIAECRRHALLLLLLLLMMMMMMMFHGFSAVHHILSVSHKTNVCKEDPGTY